MDVQLPIIAETPHDDIDSILQATESLQVYLLSLIGLPIRTEIPHKDINSILQAA